MLSCSPQHMTYLIFSAVVAANRDKHHMSCPDPEDVVGSCEVECHRKFSCKDDNKICCSDGCGGRTCVG